MWVVVSQVHLSVYMGRADIPDARVAEKIPGASDGIAGFNDSIAVVGELAVDTVGGVDARHAGTDDEHIEVRLVSDGTGIYGAHGGGWAEEVLGGEAVRIFGRGGEDERRGRDKSKTTGRYRYKKMMGGQEDPIHMAGFICSKKRKKENSK
jgi:hypothetical protein